MHVPAAPSPTPVAPRSWLRRALARVIDLRARAAVSERVRQMRRRQWVLGMAATVVAALVWLAGGLDFIERLTLDWRVYYFGAGAPAPSPAIALVAIDDAAQSTVGKWPWRRTKMAAVIDELRAAGVKVIALDLTYENASAADRGEALREAGVLDPDDAALAEAIRRHGGVVAAIKLPLRAGSATGPADTKVFRVPIDRMITILGEQPDLRTRPEADALRILNAMLLPADLRGFTRGGEFDEIRDKYRAAMALLDATPRSSLPVPSTADAIVWPSTEGPVPPLREIAQASADLATVTFDSFDPDGLVRRVPLFIEHRGRLWPSLGLSAALRYLGVPLDSLRIEGQNLVIPVQGQAARRLRLTRALAGGVSVDGLFILTWPRALFNMGLAEAAAHGWKWQFFNTDQRVPAEFPIGRVYEPVRIAEQVRDNLHTMAAAIDGEYLRAGMKHLSDEDEARWRALRTPLLATALDDPALPALFAQAEALIEKASASAADTVSGIPDDADALIAEQVADVDKAVRALEPPTGWPEALGALARAKFKDGEAFERAADGCLRLAARAVDAARTRAEGLTDAAAAARLREAAHAAESAAGALADWAALERLARAHGLMPTLRRSVRDGLNNINAIRAEIRQRLGGKVVIVGWTATGAAADFIATSVDPRTPGPHVHAAVANAVLTGFARSPAPAWADLLAILVLGTLGTLAGIRATVVLAPFAVAVLIVGWFLFSGAVLWDLWWVITAIAGPAAAAFAGLGVVMLHRLTVEQRSRRKTEERFKAYLAPAVVDILVNNPELQSMKPQRKTLSIMFTDLAGFTTTAERLGGQRTAEVLAQFLGRMTEIVQGSGATLDKYIGDAIMAFWGAPIDDPLHARHACRAAVSMIRTLDEMNAQGEFGDAGTLVMRVGIATGEVMVGDFGNPPRNSSYTVIGDTANLASRLEGANKAFGSRILIDAATRDLVGAEFACRTIGDVKVKGRTGATRLYELVGDLNPKGERTAEWIALSDEAARRYAAGDFTGALAAFDRLDREFGDRVLAALYREQIAEWQAQPAGPDGRPEGFDGSIVLTEK